MAITNEVSAEVRSQVRYVLTDTGYREKPKWLDDIPDHIKAFQENGGVIQQIDQGVTAYDVRKQIAFVINNKGGQDD